MPVSWTSPAICAVSALQLGVEGADVVEVLEASCNRTAATSPEVRGIREQ